MRTDEKLTEICNNLRMHFGDTHKACRLAGVSVDFLMNWLRDDKEAIVLVEEAQRIGFMGLESEAIRRGAEGIEKPVWYKGEIAGYETVYSDGLLNKLLEARLPAFSKKETGPGQGGTFNGPVQINIMPRASTYDEWLTMRNKTLEARRIDALPAPVGPVPEVLQGVYVVKDERPLAALEGLL